MNSHHKHFSVPLLGALALALLLCWPFVRESRQTTAEACWNNVLIECFDSTRAAWPWAKPYGANPVRRWRISPALPQLTWGLQDRFYSLGLQSFCNDEQAIWVLGGPGTEDPNFDDYPANLNTYVTYGPINLSTATEARVQFALYFRNAMDIGDTICWGADSVFTLATTHIWLDSTLAHEEAGWRNFTMDLKDLYRNNATRDSVSALGRTDVYVYWWFRSNSNQQRGRGAFLDDVIIAWDNGQIDMLAGSLSILNPDSLTYPTVIEVGDSVVFQYSFRLCDGGVLYYPPFHVMLAIDGNPILDSVIVDGQPGQFFTWFTEPIEMTAAGNFNLQLMIDPGQEVAESNEANNTTVYPFSVQEPNVRPVFEWLAPGPLSPTGDTLFAYGQGTLRWSLQDPDDDATVSIYADTDANGCLGPLIPGGSNRPEVGVDSLVWNVSGMIAGSVRWPFAQVSDPTHSNCYYAPYPVVVRSLSTGEEVLVPLLFQLAQNYPNPFNPNTQIEFAITRGGHTSLTVYDITGREVATLIDNDLTPGIYQANFDAGPDLTSGVYIYRLDAPEGSLTRKMILMK